MFLNTIRLRSHFAVDVHQIILFHTKKYLIWGLEAFVVAMMILLLRPQVEIIDGLGIKSHLVRVVKTSFLGSLTLFFFFSLLVDMVTLWTHIVCTICSLHYF